MSFATLSKVIIQLANIIASSLCDEWFCFACLGRLGVRHTADKHGADGEDLLGVGVGRDVTKADTGQAAEGKVKGSNVGATYCWASQCAVNVGCLETFAQLVEPP